MKKICFFVLSLCLLSSSYGYSEHHHHHHPKEDDGHHYLNFQVHRQDYSFSSVFDFVGGCDFLGTVVKSSFHVRTHYDLYNVHGSFEGRGICQALSLGVLFPWAKDIDVYDHNDSYIGMIDGQLLTDSKAKFSIYNALGHRIAIAYLDHASSAFTFVDANNDNQYLAHLSRQFVANAVDHWHVTVYNKDRIDLRILKVFAAFACDNQNAFREDL